MPEATRSPFEEFVGRIGDTPLLQHEILGTDSQGRRMYAVYAYTFTA
ncbi:MAG: hypothetical protein H7A46_22330 [Verrucomicrobiales bacterium]|nr:hypothetical protein [Verrucomicrobiales bacterium]